MKNKFYKTYPLYLSKNGIFHRAKNYRYVELTALGKKTLKIGGGALLALTLLTIAYLVF